MDNAVAFEGTTGCKSLHQLLSATGKADHPAEARVEGVA